MNHREQLIDFFWVLNATFSNISAISWRRREQSTDGWFNIIVMEMTGNHFLTTYHDCPLQKHYS